jgi:hypothetical protein
MESDEREQICGLGCKVNIAQKCRGSPTVLIIVSMKPGNVISLIFARMLDALLSFLTLINVQR